MRTDKLRNLIGADETTAYMVFERTLVDGLPAFEIHAASPENGPSHVLARVSPSRVPTWQIFEPEPVARWKMDRDGAGRRIQHEHLGLSTSMGAWRQITDFGGRPTFIARRVSWSSDGRWVLAAVAEGEADIFLLDGFADWRTRRATLDASRIATESDRSRFLPDCCRGGDGGQKPSQWGEPGPGLAVHAFVVEQRVPVSNPVPQAGGGP